MEECTLLHKNLIQAIRGETPMDLVIDNGKLVNTITGAITNSTIGIKDGSIAAVLPAGTPLQGEHHVNASDFYILPGFVDAFSGFSKTMLHPFYFSELVLAHGATTVVGDMTSFAETFGANGVESLLTASQDLPINMYYTAPVQVPAFPDLETTGGEYNEENIPHFLNRESVLGIGPLLNKEEIFMETPRMEHLQSFLTNASPLASSLSYLGELQKQEAFLYGVNTELSGFERNIEDALTRGQYVPLSKQDLNAERMEQILSLPDRSHLFFYSGREWTNFYMRHGHIDDVVRKAISLGMNPTEAIQCATYRPAKCMNLSTKHGFIGTGFTADLIFTPDLESLEISMIVSKGKVCFTKNKVLNSKECISFSPEMNKSIQVKRCWPHHFQLPQTKSPVAKAQVLVSMPDSLVLSLSEKELAVDERGQIQLGKDMSRAIIFERHGKLNQTHQLALIQGIGSIDGAIATTYAPHSHPLLVIGNDETDMAMAANMLISSGGGMVAIQKGQLIQSVDLPIGGICVAEPPDDLSKRLSAFSDILKRVMGMHHNRPLDWLTSLCDTTIMGYHLTDRGLVNSERNEILPLWIDTEVLAPEETYQ